MDIDEYLTLPWTIVHSEHHDDGDYVALEIEELPGFLVAARTDKELEEQFWPALEAFLLSYVERGEVPPLPAEAEPLASDQPGPPVGQSTASAGVRFGTKREEYAVT